MVIQRIAPNQYFEEETPQKGRFEILPETGFNYVPLFIFGGICIVAIVAIAIAYKK